MNFVVSTYVVKGFVGMNYFTLSHISMNIVSRNCCACFRQAAWQEPEPISVGKQFKYLKNYVTPDTMDQLASLLDFSSKACWNSLIKTQAF